MCPRERIKSRKRCRFVRVRPGRLFLVTLVVAGARGRLGSKLTSITGGRRRVMATMVDAYLDGAMVLKVRLRAKTGQMSDGPPGRMLRSRGKG